MCCNTITCLPYCIGVKLWPLGNFFRFWASVKTCSNQSWFSQDEDLLVFIWFCLCWDSRTCRVHGTVKRSGRPYHHRRALVSSWCDATLLLVGCQVARVGHHLAPVLRCLRGKKVIRLKRDIVEQPDFPSFLSFRFCFCVWLRPTTHFSVLKCKKVR